jgi:hypothetical protein
MRTAYFLPAIGITAVVAVFILIRGTAPQEVSTVSDLPGAPVAESGWCCMRAGLSCVRGYSAVTCADEAGIAYGEEEDACSFVCQSLSPQAVDDAVQP